MHLRRRYRYVLGFVVLFLAFWLPLIVLIVKSQSAVILSVADLPQADAVIVFGGLVRDNEVSHIQSQRLLAAKTIWQSGHAQKIVVSNIGHSAHVMATYLLSQNVPQDAIEMDDLATHTPDTCRVEKNKHPKVRDLIFVSNGFHLPRLLYQCQKLGVTAVAFPAEYASKAAARPQTFRRFLIKGWWYAREAALTWFAVLNLYT